MGGLRFNIQDEHSLATPRSVEECYKLAIKVEEKIRRQEKQSNTTGGSSMRGRGGRGTTDF